MAYFSNGSEGDGYMARWCERCINWKDLDDGRGPGCPIWDAHLTTDYDMKKNLQATLILNALIPMDKEGVYPQKCNMFTQISGEIEGQEHFEFEVKQWNNYSATRQQLRISLTAHRLRTAGR